MLPTVVKQGACIVGLAVSETPVGVEPNLNSDTTADGDCVCVNCHECRAANAMQDGRLIVLPWHPLTPICNGSLEHGTNCQST